MSGKIRVGVIGYGYWGPNIVRNLTTCPQTEVKIVCDRDPARLEALRTTHPWVETTTDNVDVFVHKDVDAVAVVTPLATHYAIVKEALLAGLHVLVEKPLAATAKQCDELIALASRELQALGLAAGARVTDGTVLRVPEAYPTYDSAYRASVSLIREFLDPLENFHTVGRNGMHRYDNQDHAMMTAILTVENILAGRRVRDPWLVNEDAEYHEAGRAGERLLAVGLRAVPTAALPARTAG